ncbi:unnamed protein product [Rotaria sp. Silwood1]|nr:unnamed protein product [Rotaria sp. Silwood1]
MTETLNTIGDIIRENAVNQKFVGSIVHTSGVVQQSILFNLLYTMVGGETQLLSLRISILYFLQCYLYKNESEKSKIIQKLFYQTENAANKHTLGHLLTTGILSKDIVSSWCSFIALSHLIADSQESKETILLVKLPVDQTPTGAKTLMEISFDLLTNVI